MDVLECLPSDGSVSLPMRQSRGSRYDSMAAVLGWPLVDALRRLRYFVVGAGAIGCELLKCLALMGVGSSEMGMLHVTDFDSVEKSNLSRQLLFRVHDIGQPKAETAVRAILAFNSELKARAFQERVGPDTDSIFDDEFFDSLDGVANALDNVEARLYMDQR